MKKTYNKFSQLPPEQLKWLMSYKKLYNRQECSNNDDYSFIIELLERKAFYRGYLDLVMIVNSKEIEVFLYK